MKGVKTVNYKYTNSPEAELGVIVIIHVAVL